MGDRYSGRRLKYKLIQLASNEKPEIELEAKMAIWPAGTRIKFLD
jgi:hypothetical protein